MKSKEEVEKRKLELYDSREKFSQLCRLEEKPTKEVSSAFDVVYNFYTEKISELDWVLSDNELLPDSICFKNDCKQWIAKNNKCAKGDNYKCIHRKTKQ